MKHYFFNRFAYEFEARRLLWYAPYGGSDFAEVVTVCEGITKENDEDWQAAWSDFAQKLVLRAQSFSSPISTGQVYLRASRYYQAAEFFLHYTDPRKLAYYQASKDLFYQGLDFLATPYHLHEVDYKGQSARTVFFQPDTTEILGTIFVCGGFDALLEELYFTTGQAALKAGYQVILFEGPGQSDLLRYHHCHFTPDWEDICQTVLDYYESKQLIIGPKIGLGLSLGGLLLSCAAVAKPNFFDKIVLHNYFPSLLDSFKFSMPKALHRFIDHGFPTWLEYLASHYIRYQHFLNWQVEHAKWTFGGQTINELLGICQTFSEKLKGGKLETDCLVLLAKNDNYYDYRLGLNFFETITANEKKLVLFDKTNFSSDLHCQNGAAFDSNDQIFQWLLETGEG